MSERAKISSQKTKSKKGDFASKAKQPDFSRVKSSPVDQILHLHQTAGNQAVQGLLESGTIQPKLKIGKPGDKYELEADRMAEQVMRMTETSLTCDQRSGVSGQQSLVNSQSSLYMKEEKPIQITPLVQRQNEEEERKKREEEELVQPKLFPNRITPIVQRQIDEEEKKKEEELIQPKGKSSDTTEISPDVESSINSLRGGGQPLPESVRNYFEPRFGYDFSGVRVHTGDKASDVARSVNSKAFTSGNNVVFNTGNYSPETEEGRSLLAHELTHVVQQRGASSYRVMQFQFGCTPVPMKQSAEEKLIAEYTSWGNLDEEALGKRLLTLALKGEISFVVGVINALGYFNRDDVSYEFADHATDYDLKIISCSEKGRNLLKRLSNELYKGWPTSGETKEAKRMSDIAEEVQNEIWMKQWEMMRSIKTRFTVNIYPGGTPIDAAEMSMPGIAKKRPGTPVGVRNLQDLLNWITEESKKRDEAGLPYQIEAMNLLGHGSPGEFAIGDYMYTPKVLKTYPSVSECFKSGAVVVLDGCNAAGEPGGKKLIEEFGRIFFGKKSGIIRGNTCSIIGLGETTSCKPVEFRYPDMKKYTPEELIREKHVKGKEEYKKKLKEILKKLFSKE